ncbi:MAG: alpha/beta hydrolase-fold protein, partial [Bacteroidota bacterium]
RTNPYSVLAGHSFGGLFTVYASMEDVESFQGYIALSPSLGRNSEQQVKKAAEFYTNKSPDAESIYVAVGNEGGYTAISTQKYADILQKQDSELRFKFERLEENSHESITIDGFLHGLKFIYEGFNLQKYPELDEIFLVEEHYTKLSKRFGYEVKVPEFQYQRFTQEQMAAKEWDYASFILGKYEQQYPESIELVSLKADLYLLMGDFKQARSYYKILKDRGAESERLSRILKELED